MNENCLLYFKIIKANQPLADVQQIIMNLVSNSIKFTDKGSVTLTTEVTSGEDNTAFIKITVEDTGIGIHPDNVSSIFHKFTQADETITRRYGGSGLGLSIAHSLATLMEGDITVESQVGKGSIFTVTLKLTRCWEKPTELQKQSPQMLAGHSSHHKTVLLVEDYAPNVMVATMMLEDLGYEVISVNNGHDALNMIKEQERHFEVIFMDVQMHGMDGLETTRRIRQYEAETGIRNTIIGVTAHALAGDRDRCLSSGMDDYISKPIHPDILAAKLQKAMPII